MSYIGRSVDAISNVEKLDNITFNGGTTYALTKSSTAFVPSGANNILISIDGVVQQGNFSVSGSNIVFTFSPTSSNTCDFIMHYGTGLITTPGDGTVTSAKLGADSVNGDKIADDSISDEHLDVTAITGQPEKTSLVDADKFLISDSAASNALKYVQKSNLPSGALSLISATAVTDGVSAFNINSVFSSSFQMYMMIVQNIRVTADANVRLRFGVSGTFDSSSQYRYVGIGRDRSGTDRSYNDGSDTSMLIVKELDGNDGLSHAFGVYYFANPNIAATNSNRKRVTGHYHVANASGNSVTTTYNFAGELEVSTTAFDGIRLLTDSGNFRGGVAGDGDGMIKIYGIADS